MNTKRALGAAGLLLGLGAGFALGVAKQRKRFSFYGRTVLITGGSRGLGLVMARQLARQGARLALLARDREELARAEAELAGGGAQALAISCDVRKREQINQAIDAVVKRFGGIDVLINAVGIIQVGPLEHMIAADFEEAMAVNFFGPLYVTLAALPYLRRAGGGRIVNISSIGGKIAVPHLLPYTASKFALAGLSDGLRAELRKDNIYVTTVCPGLMRTGSPRNALFKGNYRKEYAWFAIGDSLPLVSMNVNRAARKILRACRRGSPRLLLGVQTGAAVLVNDLFPGISTALTALANLLLPGLESSGSTESHTGWESFSKWAPSWLTRATERAARRNNEVLGGG